jgi:hypothetical protein
MTLTGRLAAIILPQSNRREVRRTLLTGEFCYGVDNIAAGRTRCFLSAKLSHHGNNQIYLNLLNER